jgi:hypothetical protein
VSVIFRRRCLRSRSMLIAALAGLTLAGCTGTTSRRPAPSASIPAVERRSNVRTPETGVLRCGDSVTGDLGSDWQRNAVTAGPLAIAGARLHATQLQPQRSGGPYVAKALVVVEPGKTVTLAIGEETLGHASLNHGVHPPTGGAWTIQDGVRSVTFEACAYKETQFSGSILLDAPRCLPLRVTQSDGRTWRVVVSICVGTCSRASSS